MAHLPSFNPLRVALSLAAVGSVLPVFASDQVENATVQLASKPLEEVTIIGDRQATREIAGSGALIDLSLIHI